MADITIVNGVYKPTNITGGRHPVRKPSLFAELWDHLGSEPPTPPTPFVVARALPHLPPFRLISGAMGKSAYARPGQRAYISMENHHFIAG
jgi:hypothetical protein